MKQRYSCWLAQTQFCCFVLLIFGFAMNAAAQTVVPPCGLTASVDGSPSSQPTGCSPTSTGPFTISSQEPITLVPNPNAMFATPLPSTVTSHIAVAGGPYLSSSATMIAAQLSFAASGLRGVLNWQQAAVGADQQVPKYYGQSTDPVYQLTSCPPYTPPPGTLNTPFHLASGARFSAGGADRFLAVWDQTNNNIFALYAPSMSAIPACPGGGHAGTASDPCQIALASPSACGKSNFYSTTANTPNDGGWATGGILPPNGLIRMQEIVSGHIYHALYLDIACSSQTTVFPNSTGSTANWCANEGNVNSNGMPNGALIFLDYTTAQLADIKTKVPAWQYPFLEALTVYGGYFQDTGAIGSSGGIYPSRAESEVAYNVAGIATPHPAGFTNFFSWLASQAHSNCSIISPSGGYKCNLAVFENVPAEPNNIGGSGTDIASHMHVADQCVAKAQAGVSGGCP